ncbi:hypothetical protein IW140_000717 [Coemansia sp. RSA 1813]|nr:hypothetical protein EV178_000778 [Coemansia sp. RSA 1646]KAJ1773586.1 hypothetical protein LPJ74_000502 [Coemansia sp. RSA 1843]KAJ2092398.1 hypothetical protein IW138_001160 [Coemansia sp. RSA 986]KAJ2217377.1 hypothetical protein EV179_000527 [Coemansia sp. RSA 487]KAJ2572602.1 hypothetical protein IW140_000717 [Coemansia sp. RSA 1813]
MSEEKVQKQVDQFGLAVDNVHRALGPILSQPLGETLPKLSAMQRCELEALVAYSINTLFFVYLKANGVPPKEHPVMNELQRVQRYIEKINKTKNHSGGADARPLKVDKDAADRLIRSAINSK